jgi:hypothetical protein
MASSSVPIKNKSGYLLYCSDVRETIKSSNPEIKSVEIVKRMGEGWRNLADDKKKDYEDRAIVDKERFLKEKEAWIASNPGVDMTITKTKKRAKKEKVVTNGEPEEIVIMDHELVQEATPAPKKRGSKKVATAVVAEPVVEAPAPVVVTEEKKKPLNKFQNFCSIQRAKLKVEKPQLKPKEVTTELGAMWKALSPQEQEAFSA